MTPSDLDELITDPWSAACVLEIRLFTRHGETAGKVVVPLKVNSEDGGVIKKEANTAHLILFDTDEYMKGTSDESVHSVAENEAP
ncbi:MAG: hypothetical protein GOMPHAMPRED_004261 [Gomphillus americanus]|uniref:Uncharacterized protein n=1 Tax=Gomphillus americanus TaxID=1940652 RepID=A0A8H3FPZ7_9LECA|nr:MAG: hypothetical protein GOMPHAMPRED_004261 [Gomphillus americanus]